MVDLARFARGGYSPRPSQVGSCTAQTMLMACNVDGEMVNERSEAALAGRRCAKVYGTG